MAKNPKAVLSGEQAEQRLTDMLGRNTTDFPACGCAGDFQAAQGVSDLIEGKRRLAGFDIEADLSHPFTRRQNAGFIALAYLLRAGADERAALLADLQPEWFTHKLARFLFLSIQQPPQDGPVDLARVQAGLEDCGPVVFGSPLNPPLRLTVYQWWFTTLATAPTLEQYQRAKSILAGDDGEESVIS